LALAESLWDRLSELRPRIVVDGTRTGHRTLSARPARLESVEEGATHHLTLEDDAEPCADFEEQMM
jgi:hypothetical protein